MFDPEFEGFQAGRYWTREPDFAPGDSEAVTRAMYRVTPLIAENHPGAEPGAWLPRYRAGFLRAIARGMASFEELYALDKESEEKHN